MAMIGKFDKTKHLRSSRPGDQDTADWPMLLASMMSKAYANPKATGNLRQAHMRDLSRALWGAWATPDCLGLGESKMLYSKGLSAPGRSARLFMPTSATPGAPLVVMLHGCMQDARSFAKLTRMDDIAKAEGFFVLYPDQESSANAMQCWNWNSAQNQTRLGGEPESLASLISQAQALCGTGPERTRVAGISAGGALAATMAHLYPELLGAVAVVAGPAPFVAQNLPQALGAMARGPATGSRHAIEQQAEAAGLRQLSPRKLPMLIVQGMADETVNPKNALMQERSALALNEALAQSIPNGAYPRKESSSGRHGRARIWRDEDGSVIACVVSPSSLGHAWSGGHPSEPFSQTGFDQSRLALDFFEAAESGQWDAFEPKALADKLWGHREAHASSALLSAPPSASSGALLSPRPA